MSGEPITQRAGAAEGCAGNEDHQVKAKLTPAVCVATRRTVASAVSQAGLLTRAGPR